ncbi:uncharacterized protein LOC143356422 [Halictus rubicundus]|uniref:uncharacterized protein LOC143356422 n=1 Tax=Halictus rubicundus TaxID=77578 RepID=UPI0040366876
MPRVVRLRTRKSKPRRKLMRAAYKYFCHRTRPTHTLGSNKETSPKTIKTEDHVFFELHESRTSHSVNATKSGCRPCPTTWKKQFLKDTMFSNTQGNGTMRSSRTMFRATSNAVAETSRNVNAQAHATRW